MYKSDGRVKIPKQFGHWCKINKIKFDMKYYNGFSINKLYTEYTKNRKRHFRVNNLNQFEICDGDMDRWANSTYRSTTVPRTYKEFIESLLYLMDGKD